MRLKLAKKIIVFTVVFEATLIIANFLLLCSPTCVISSKNNSSHCLKGLQGLPGNDHTQIVLWSRARSGSSFSGELLSVWNTFLSFEPIAMLWPELWDTSDMNRNINASVAVQFLRDVLLCKFAKYPEYVRYIFIEMRFYGNEFFDELCPDYTGGYCESLDLLTTLCMAFKTHVVKIVRLHIRNAFEILEERIPVFTAVERNYTNERSKANSKIAKERNLLQLANVHKLRNYSIKGNREKLHHNFSSGHRAKTPDNVGEELYVNVSKGHLAKTSNQVAGGALPLNFSLHLLAKLPNQVDGEKLTLNTPKDPVAKLFNKIFTKDLTLNASKYRSAKFPYRDDEQVSLNASRYQTANLSIEEMRLKLIPLEMFNYLSPERYAYFRSFFQENAFIDPKHFPVVQKNIKIVHLVRDPR
ncbi:hypothetical protein SK128_015133, partial [Halocaridina rubra]